MAPSVYVIVVNLMAGYEAGIEEIRWWRRFLRAVMPRGTVPPIALVGSRSAVGTYCQASVYAVWAQILSEQHARGADAERGDCA